LALYRHRVNHHWGELTVPDDTRTTASRRAVLAAALGGAAAWIATALGQAQNVRAGSDGDVVLGASNTAAAVTTIEFAGNDALVGRSAAPTHSGLWGDNTGNGYGVSGSTAGATTAGVWGNNSSSGTGVKGTSASGPGLSGSSTKNAIFGSSSGDLYTGVWGENTAAGYGVYGTTGSADAAGVWGVNSAAGMGVQGTSDSGIGVSAGSKTGVALDVVGKARFSRSGKASVLAGKKSVKVTLAGVTASTLVFANLATNASGRYVAAVVPAAGSFTIYLNANAAAKVSVAWLVADK
jgi:hypothetical protein